MVDLPLLSVAVGSPARRKLQVEIVADSIQTLIFSLWKRYLIKILIFLGG